jgi:hypothetical protein
LFGNLWAVVMNGESWGGVFIVGFLVLVVLLGSRL